MKIFKNYTGTGISDLNLTDENVQKIFPEMSLVDADLHAVLGITSVTIL